MNQPQNEISLEEAVGIAELVSFHKEDGYFRSARFEGRDVLQYGAKYASQFRDLLLIVSNDAQLGEYMYEERDDYKLDIVSGEKTVACYAYDAAVERSRLPPESKIKDLYHKIEKQLKK